MRARCLDFKHALLAILAAPVLVTGAAARASGPGDDPGTGALVVRHGDRLEALPMASMSVELAVSGIMVRGKVAQSFTNPTGDTIDAVYMFPLPQGAAVDGLVYEVGGRSYAGVVREKEEAKKIFAEAQAAGRGAGLVEQHRPNLFRTSVANIPPHATVVLRLTTIDEAEWSEGGFSTTFPTTITPRYDPSTCGASTTTAGALIPSISIAATIDAGVPLAEVASSSHRIRTERGGRLVSIAVGDGPVLADRDFVLRWRPESSAAPAAGGLVEERADGRYGLAIVVPPALDRDGAPGFPTQTVFVVDISGSMAGPSLSQAKQALRVALDRLRPGDTFTMIEFDDRYETMSDTFLDAGPASIARARSWVDRLEARGGTEILPALLRAIDISESGDPRALKRVVLVTDGAVENEEEIVAAVPSRLGGTRLHVVGIGSAPNRWLMTELARAGRGTYEAVGASGEVEERIGALLTRTERAVLTDVALEWDGAPPLDADPDPVPDLYAGRPIVVTARFDPSKPLPKLRVWGKAPGGPATMEVDFSGARPDAGIGTRWARARVAALERSRVRGADGATVRADVVALAERFSLVTPYTSFVVVADVPSESRQDDGDGDLPQGGTGEPLRLALGIALFAAGGALLAVSRLAWGRAR